VLADKTSADHRLLIRDIAAIAVQLQRLEDAGIPAPHDRPAGDLRVIRPRDAFRPDDRLQLGE